MERHFAIPVTIAAVLHGVLFGIPRGAVPDVPADPIRLTGDDVPAIPIVPPDTRPDEDTGGDASGGSPVELPRRPELPPVDDGPGITIPVPITTRVSVDRGDIFSIPSTFGTGTGIGTGIGPGIMGSAMLDRSPNARVRIPPEYPVSARLDGREGEVTVEFVVDESGCVLAPRVVGSSDNVFNDAALRAVARWRFVPGTVKGIPVRFRMAVPIVFKLD